MPYDNMPKVGGSYGDGSFRQPDISSQPRVLVVAPAASGLSNEVFRVANVREVEREFGAATDLAQGLHEAIGQGAENLSVMRVGGRQGKLVVTDSAAGTLTITPENRDDKILDRYALAMSVTGTAQRIGVFDLTDSVWIFDSDEVLVLDEGVVDVASVNLDLFTVGSFTDETLLKAMSALVTGDFTQAGAATLTSVVATAGADGTSVTLVEKYAALNTGYHLLDFKDADHIVPMGVFADDKNLADGDSLSLWAGQPLSGESDALGLVWQYIYQGKLYTYMVDSATYFTDLASAVAAELTINTDLVLTAVDKGAGINSKVTFEVTAAAASDVVTTVITETAGVIAIVVDVQDTSGTIVNSAVATSMNTALAAFAMSNGLTADTIVAAVGGATVLNAAVASATIGSGTAGVGGDRATHADLTGDVVPAAVETKFLAGADAEVREVNFPHQLATFCRLASTTWSTMQGFIGFNSPPGFSRTDVAAWVGELPTFTTIGDAQAVSAGNNGNGLLGYKFLAGASGYRDAQVSAGGVNDGLAFGGFIQTKGASLPNGSDFAYGVSENDELLDLNQAPVDIGKHIYVFHDWPIHRNGFNGGTPYRGPQSAQAAGLLATLPVNEEPIGQNGRITQIASPPRIHSTQKDALASIRSIGTRFEPDTGHIFVSFKTAAHPDSDYTRSSTIRSVNRILSGIRNIGKKYLGKAFSPENIVSLRAAIDGYLTAERGLGIHSGAIASVHYTRSDKILGKLEVRLRMVPPFSIEQIQVNITLAADESEL